jgi:hypothetical protein
MIKYKCNDNYILHDGVEFQTCVESGAWNGTKPRCAGIFISKQIIISHLQLIEHKKKYHDI